MSAPRGRTSRTSIVMIGAILGAILGATAGAPAHAKLPDPSRCTVPRFIDIVGESSGEPDASGRFTIVIRDFLNNPEPFVSVQLVVAPQCLETRLCSALVDGQTVDCSSGIVTATTGLDGAIHFVITGAADDMGTTAPPATAAGAGADCIRMYADGIQLGFATAVVYDVNGRSPAHGNPGVNGLDLSIVKLEVGAAGLGAPYRGRCDYTHDGRINGADLARFAAIVGGGGSTGNCATMCP